MAMAWLPCCTTREKSKPAAPAAGIREPLWPLSPMKQDAPPLVVTAVEPLKLKEQPPTAPPSERSSNETEEALSVEASPVLKDSAPAPISEEPQETAAEPKKPKKKKVQNEDLVADAMAARALAKKNKAKKAKNSS